MYKLIVFPFLFTWIKLALRRKNVGEGRPHDLPQQKWGDQPSEGGATWCAPTSNATATSASTAASQGTSEGPGPPRARAPDKGSPGLPLPPLWASRPRPSLPGPLPLWNSGRIYGSSPVSLPVSGMIGEGCCRGRGEPLPRPPISLAPEPVPRAQTLCSCPSLSFIKKGLKKKKKKEEGKM